MINKEFALGTWEMHLQSDIERSSILDNMTDICKYIDTAIDYNNDYLLTKHNTENYTIISKISSYHFDNYELFVQQHLNCLDRDVIDIMLIHSNRGNWQQLAKKISTDSRFTEIGVSNFTYAEIIEFKTITGRLPAYCEIEINPFYCDLDVIQFCKKNNIKVIAYGILGGKYNCIRNIADYSLPYLISFAANYADIVIIKPESFRHINEYIDIVQNYSIDTESIQFSSIYVDRKSVEPMNYKTDNLYTKLHLSIPTYNNAVGENLADPSLIIKEIDSSHIPHFEMLGDYMTWLRYMYKRDYDENPVYNHDLLVGDDGAYYVIFIFEKDTGKLTKINPNNTNVVKLFKLFKN